MVTVKSVRLPSAVTVSPESTAVDTLFVMVSVLLVHATFTVVACENTLFATQNINTIK